MPGASAITYALPRLAAALIALLYAAAPARAEAILPTAEGTTWEYEVRDSAAGPDAARLIVRIGGTDEIGARQLLRLETVAGDVVTKTELISVDQGGVHCHQRAGADGRATILEPPQTMIPAPLGVGVTWQVNDHVSGGGLQQFRVVGEEEVSVPAGTFRTFRLRCEQPWPISTTTDRWFAPGTGVVKDVTTTRGPNGRLLSRAATVLKKLQVAAQRADETGSSGTTPPQAPAAPALRAAILLEVSGEREGAPRTEFKSDAPQIFVRWSGVNLPVGESVRVAWVAEDVGDVAPPNFVVDETETTIETAEFGARFTLSRPKDGWAAGRYRVDLYVGAELVQKLNVTIAD